jgi:hypothetical protein
MQMIPEEGNSKRGTGHGRGSTGRPGATILTMKAVDIDQRIDDTVQVKRNQGIVEKRDTSLQTTTKGGAIEEKDTSARTETKIEGVDAKKNTRVAIDTTATTRVAKTTLGKNVNGARSIAQTETMATDGIAIVLDTRKRTNEDAIENETVILGTGMEMRMDPIGSTRTAPATTAKTKDARGNGSARTREETVIVDEAIRNSSDLEFRALT